VQGGLWQRVCSLLYSVCRGSQPVDPFCKYADINITGLPFVSTVDSNFQDRFGTSDSFVFWDGSEGVFAYRRDITRMEGARRKLKIMAKQG
jgi:hypothetical protein